MIPHFRVRTWRLFRLVDERGRSRLRTELTDWDFDPNAALPVIFALDASLRVLEAFA